MKLCITKSRVLLISSLFLLAVPALPAASDSTLLFDHSLADKLLSVETKDMPPAKGGYQTKVLLTWNGKIPGYANKVLHDPARIVIDIFTHTHRFKSRTIAVNSRHLKGLRLGYHPGKMRLVLDIKGPVVPSFVASSHGNKLRVILGTQGSGGQGKAQAAKREKGRGKATNKALFIRYPKNSMPSKWVRIDLEKELIQPVADDSKKDTALFLKSLSAYRQQKWREATSNLNQLLKTYPNGRYSEKGLFLIAKSYEKLYSGSVLAHFLELKGYYEKAVRRFPGSRYAACALLAIGNLYLEAKGYHEALAYYSLVLEKDTTSTQAFHAFVQKIRILTLKKRLKEAMSIAEHLVRNYPAPPEAIVAQIEMAKVLYEMNSFKKSLRILSRLARAKPENVYLYPEIALYAGRNCVQLGQNTLARENLLRFYNTYPEAKESDVTLAAIGDTYLNDALTKKAADLYELVLRLYPDTEGALISLIRLAEIKEQGNAAREQVRIIRPIGPSKTEEGISSPVEIYEKVLGDLLEKDPKHPLAELALFKLAVLYRKKKQFDKSLRTLQELLRKFPSASSKPETQYALKATISALLSEKMKAGKYADIVNTYLKGKELFALAQSPGPLLSVARASSRLGLEDFAAKIFKKATLLLTDKEKPADLLFTLAKEDFKKGYLAEAISNLDQIIKNHHASKYASSAYRLKGEIFLKQGKPAQAAELFSEALGLDPQSSNNVGTLVEKARALADANLVAEALQTLKTADNLRAGCHLPDPRICEQIGNLYLRLGVPRKALSAFNAALQKEKNEKNKILLKLLLGKCYRALNAKKEYLALFEQISRAADPFWSRVAEERIQEIRFNSELKKIKRLLPKGDSTRAWAGKKS